MMILDIYPGGVKLKDICEYYGMLKSIVHNIVRREQMKRNQSSNENWGRNPKLSKKSIRSLLSYNKNQQIQALTHYCSKIQSIRRSISQYEDSEAVFTQAWIANYATVSKPFLSIKNMGSRMKWAYKHVKWTQNQWDTIIFCDESSFTVRLTALRKRVLRKANTQYYLNDQVPIIRSVFPSLSVWAAFLIRASTPLIHILRTLNQKQ